MRRSRTRRLTALGVALALGAGGAAIVVACSSDASPDLPAPFDAQPFDATQTDTSRPGADAAPDAAATGPFCNTIDASSVLLCDDFDSVTAPLFGFDTLTREDGGSSVSVSDEGGVDNASGVLDVTIVQKNDAGQSAFLTKNLPGPGAPDSFLHYQVDVDFRVVGASAIPYAALGGLQFPDGGIKEHGFAVYDGNVFARLVPKDFAVKDDKSLWHHASIVLDRPAGSTVSSFTTTITLDGTQIDNVGGVDPGATGASKVRLGAYATDPTTGTLRAQFDNVVVRRW